MMTTNPVPSSSSNKRIAAAAQEFESVLVGQWLTEAESSFGTVPGSEQPDDPGASQMNEFAMQHLASEITKKGGIGIARLVEAGLMKSNTPPDATPATIHASQVEE
jgi:Rod binding domain-containing protein